jgi:putative ABC transport system ATP-binding protein
MTDALRLENVSMTFDEAGQRHTILNEVSATFAAGKFSVLLGQSGSGKSTVLNLLSGLDQPTAGKIWHGNTCLSALSERERTLFRRRHMGIVFQFFNLIPTLTVLENVCLSLELNGRKERASAQELLKAVGLGTRYDTYPDKLSGGEQQRVAIARALAHDPPLILADEPTGNLDEETGKQVLEVFLNLTREQGKTLIMVTHNPDIVPLADEAWHLQEHRLQQRLS